MLLSKSATHTTHRERETHTRTITLTLTLTLILTLTLTLTLTRSAAQSIQDSYSMSTPWQLPGVRRGERFCRLGLDLGFRLQAQA